ncbi:hypothetical protein DPMN_004808 [Dreissena polymorpha]|uniref:Uncharacterized protein n=1 Tax=Dreissena polymorpha TaxID=45954 RepID=A0A9D4MSC7_DREPO|nr:hypothetical protein DPMN_004808 [Dreissena polymorpha]
MCRLYIFNKRRIAEVEDMLLEAYQNRPEWDGDLKSFVPHCLTLRESLQKGKFCLHCK